MSKTWQVMFYGSLVAQFDYREHAVQFINYDSGRVTGVILAYQDEDMERTVFTEPLNTIETYWLYKMKTGKEI